jgi:hypothetical protein
MGSSNAETTCGPTLPRRTRQTVARERFLRRRQKLAAILESELDPRHPLRHGLRSWERIPPANRTVVADALREIATLLRDPAVTIPERALRRVLAFVTDRTSPAYGEYPNQAGFAAHSLVAEIRACTAGQGRSPLDAERAKQGREWGGRAGAVPDASG